MTLEYIQIPGLTLLEAIGQGGQSVVYRALRGESVYAVKVLRADRHGDSDAWAVHFRREAALLARISHPGLVKVYESGEAAGRPYIVMEHIDGRPLSALLVDGPLPEDAIVRIARDVAGA
ncbi:MAG: protein kinase, partial [Candidatus Methylomirabilis sp.]|nr:protein kinase [Deltaproteobacteria bacterium]